MPGRDGTGPVFDTPVRGRGIFCTRNFNRGYTASQRYRARNFNYENINEDLVKTPRWVHFGCRYADSDLSDVQRKELLIRQAEYLQDRLKEVKNRISDIEKE
ncbi:MAG: DUF5320 domain-containing protein [Eubacteriales bacterium]